MCTFENTQKKIYGMIDELKGLCSSYGLSNQASEEVVITTVFLYKFLNDKYMYNLQKFANEISLTVEELLADENMLEAFKTSDVYNITFDYNDTIQVLGSEASKDNFYKKFEHALENISSINQNLSIRTAEGAYEPLLEPVCKYVDESKRNMFARSLFSIISIDKFDFSATFASSFDFYSSIFEYLIKDYNVAAGRYAEYFTPQAVSSIIAKCLVGMSEVIEVSEINDPSAGSGSLILHLGNELRDNDGNLKAIVYTQDISRKSTRFLRLNLILNGMTESLKNVVCGDTLLEPSHFQTIGEPTSGLKLFDYIVSNPPFKTDFSATRDAIERRWDETDRFFAGVPNVPKTKKESMSIYLLFIQHVLYTLKENGKAAIVVPTGFLTAKSGIEMVLREKLVENHWIKGVISMPSNIFANTGTNVSVLFIDKANNQDTAIFIDASNLGEKVKDGKNQRTVLSNTEIENIIDTFVNHKDVENFAVTVSYDKIKERGCSFSAGQYFEVKIEHVEITAEEFNTRIKSILSSLDSKFAESRRLESQIMQQVGELKI